MSVDRVARGRIAAAWSVHLLTASGAVCCLLALAAAADVRWQAMFVWLALAVLIDGVDGALARAVDVKTVLPGFDGTLLDAIVDYAGYVLVPAFALGRSALLPDPVAWPVASGICLASAYQFCQASAKTDDHFFLGFPSYWNILLFYLFIWRIPPEANLAILAACIVLVFVPVKYVYPSRTPTFRSITLVLSAGWGLTVLGMLWHFPDPPRWMSILSLVYVAYYTGLSLYLNWSSADGRPTGKTR